MTRRREPARTRRRMLASALAAASVLAVTAWAAAAVPTVTVHVSPPTGLPSTTFTISFRTSDRTGVHGALARRDELMGAVARHGSGCVSGFDTRTPDGAAGALIRVALGPRRIGGRWCTGRWSGRIEELETPVCKPDRACPQFIILRGVIGHFTLTVTSAPTPGAGNGPSFAGLASAFACTPGPQRPGQTTPFTLTWKAATDPLTPSAQIVYEVFVSTTPGGEDFSKPSWTTAPGVTSFRTPGLASHGTFYFVVRARDGTGDQDANTVEVRGVDPCL
jgi:hypothetical protein